MRRKRPAAVALADDPAAAWKVPAHVLARTEQPTPEQAQRIERTLRAHTLMVAPAGDLVSVVMSGYLSDPAVPHRFMTATLGCPLRAGVRAAWAAQFPELVDLAVHSAADTGGQPFNLFGSLLAAELGFALEPLYGTVFFGRMPGAGGVVGKLPVAAKELIAFKLITLEAVAAKVRPDFVHEEDYLLAWARIRTLLALAHRMRDTADTTQ